MRVTSSLLLSSKEIDSSLLKAQVGGDGSGSLGLKHCDGDVFPLCKEEDDPKGKIGEL